MTKKEKMENQLKKYTFVLQQNKNVLKNVLVHNTYGSEIKSEKEKHFWLNEIHGRIRYDINKINEAKKYLEKN